jgi:hypothetical protein
MYSKSNIFTGAIVFIIVLAVAVSAGAKTDLTFDVPAPPQGKLLDTKELRIGNRQVEMVLYGSAASSDTIAEYYAGFFQQHDFQKIAEEQNAKIKKQLLQFKKKELIVNVAIMLKEDRTEVAVAKYLQLAGEPPLEKTKPSVKDTLFALPKEDVAGKDLPVVPRPPESVRIMDMERGSSATIMYTTSLDVDAAADFYRVKMPGQEWTLTNEIAAKKAVEAYENTTGKKTLEIKSPFSDGEDFEQVIRDSYMLNFDADFGTAQITIFPNFLDRKLGSMVQITYSEKS